VAHQPETKRSAYVRRWSALKNERSSWFSHWREISDYLMPRQGRFFLTDRNVGKKRHNNIYDSTGTKALGRLSAGLMAGMTSPARPWFRLAVSDTKLMELSSVKNWLDDVSTLMREVFARSNTYRALHSQYKELAGFGTAATIVVNDFDNIIHMHPLTVGEYAVATDFKGYVNTLYREFDMTVAQLVGEFGIDNVSKNVKDSFDRANFDQWITVLHLIEPRNERDSKKRDSKNMPYASVYLEAAGDDDDKVLRESGFKLFPAICPRWDVSGGDIYGNSPGMEALGDIRQLQHQQLRKAEGIDYQVKPPVQIPIGMRGQENDLLPGGTSYYDLASPNGAIKTAFEVNINLQHLLMDIQDVRMRIKETFYEDLFLMIANDNRSNITAREIAERHEEKLIMLGPVLERLHNEMLAPLIDITFEKIVEAGALPPPPKEMQGMDINVEFVSMLAQAQRAVGTGSIDRLLGTVGSIAQLKPEVLDKLDGDQIIDAYSDMLGVDPDLIVADDKVAIIRADRAKQQAAAQQAAMVPQMAQTAKTLSEADLAGDNGLSALTRQFTQL
jgi:hypothetical protein